MFRTHTRTALRIGMALCVVAFAAILARDYFTRHAETTSVADSVRFVAQAVKDLLAHNPAPTQREVDDAIFTRDQSRTTHLWRDANGRPVDAWGTPFAIEFTPGNAGTPVTCRSAGPDRTMHTADDIVYTAR